MNKFKLFSEYTIFIDNTINSINECGEMSTYSASFRRDFQTYSDDKYPNILLRVFTSVGLKDKSVIPIEMTESDRVVAFKILNLVWDNVKKAGVNNKATHANPSSVFFASNINEFETWKKTYNITKFELGKSSGKTPAPEWVEFSIGEKAYYKIWLKDQSFRDQYDEFEIIIVPPLPQVDNFFFRKDMIQRELAKMTAEVWSQRIDDAKGNIPETSVCGKTFEWRNPIDPEDRLPVVWAAIHYGKAGESLHEIKKAIQKYILDNSEHTREEWEKVFPDIFLRTEFLIAPLWNNVAIDTTKLTTGIYSPIVNPNKDFSVLEKYTKDDYKPEHIKTYYEVIKHPFKSLMLLSTSRHTNRDNIYSLKAIYKDYIAENTESQDFNRQVEDTREFSEALNKAIILAEDMDNYTELPSEFKRHIKDEYLYILFNFKDIEFLVKTKYDEKITVRTSR